MDWNILGHEWAVALLQAHIQRGEVRHAYLLCGPSGVGRRTLAIRLVQALNCLEPPELGGFCSTCLTCRQIERMQYSDLLVVQAEQVGGILKVDQVRELQRSLSLAPYQGRYKTALLLRFEEANANAMNALLKTLEEPAPQVIILLTADSPESLLPTIVSRCEVLRLRPLSMDLLSQGLQERRGYPGEKARLLAHLSSGKPGLAVRMAEQPEQLEQRAACLDDLSRLISASMVERFDYADAVAKDKAAMREKLLIWLSFWRDVTLKVSGTRAPLTNLDRTDEISELAARLDLHFASHLASSLAQSIEMLDQNVNPRLIVENIMLDLPA